MKSNIFCFMDCEKNIRNVDKAILYKSAYPEVIVIHCISLAPNCMF